MRDCVIPKATLEAPTMQELILNVMPLTGLGEL